MDTESHSCPLLHFDPFLYLLVLTVAPSAPTPSLDCLTRYPPPVALPSSPRGDHRRGHVCGSANPRPYVRPGPSARAVGMDLLGCTRAVEVVVVVVGLRRAPSPSPAETIPPSPTSGDSGGGPRSSARAVGMDLRMGCPGRAVDDGPGRAALDGEFSSQLHSRSYSHTFGSVQGGIKDVPLVWRGKAEGRVALLGFAARGACMQVGQRMKAQFGIR